MGTALSYYAPTLTLPLVGRGCYASCCLGLLLFILSFLSCAAFAAEPVPPESEPVIEYNKVVLQGLNKVTGRSSKLEGPLGTVMRFGTLEVIARRCWKAPPDERPENAALLEIRELKAEEAPQKIFLGWMFSSSPGLSGLEHPVYDVNVLSCESTDAEKKETATAPDKKTSGVIKKDTKP